MDRWMEETIDDYNENVEKIYRQGREKMAEFEEAIKEYNKSPIEDYPFSESEMEVIVDALKVRRSLLHNSKQDERIHLYKINDILEWLEA